MIYSDELQCNSYLPDAAHVAIGDNCVMSIEEIKANRRTRLHALAQWLNQAELARALGIAPAQITQMSSPNVKSKRPVSDAKARQIEAVCGLPKGWLDQPGTPEPIPGLHIRNPNAVRVTAYEVRGVDGVDGVDPDTDVMIDVVDIEVSAGDGVPVPEFVATRYRLPYQIEWLRKYGAQPEDIRIFPVRGDSMIPTLFGGDKAVCHMKLKKVESGRTYALVYGGEARIKRLFNTIDGGLRVVSNNPDKELYPDEFIAADDMPSVLILGRIIDRSGPGDL